MPQIASYQRSTVILAALLLGASGASAYLSICHLRAGEREREQMRLAALTKRAESGEIPAARDLATYYSVEKGDTRKTLIWLERAAMLGDPASRRDISEMQATWGIDGYRYILERTNLAYEATLRQALGSN